MATWLQTVNRNMGGERGVNTAKAVASLGMGNPLGALYYGFKAFNTPSEKGWGSAIQKTGSTTVPDLQNQISAAASGLYQRPAALPGMGEYGTTVQDVQNTFIPSGGIQQPVEEAAPASQVAPPVAPSVAPPVQQPKIQPKTMPMPSDLEFIYGAKDSAYQSLVPPALQTPTNPMTANGGFFDMNKAGTVGGQYIQGVGWMTDAARAAGLKPEDLEFQAMMQQRIASMYQ